MTLLGLWLYTEALQVSVVDSRDDAMVHHDTEYACSAVFLSNLATLRAGLVLLVKIED